MKSQTQLKTTKTFKFKPYIGGAGPSDKLVENNDLYLLQELKKLSIECTYEADVEWNDEIGFNSFFKTVNVKYGEKILHVSFDRYGYVCEEIDEVDQTNPSFTLEKIVQKVIKPQYFLRKANTKTFVYVTKDGKKVSTLAHKELFTSLSDAKKELRKQNGSWEIVEKGTGNVFVTLNPKPEKEIPVKEEFQIYIPEEGHWPIPGNPKTKEEARKSYLKWAKRKRLPSGSFIDKVVV